MFITCLIKACLLNETDGWQGHDQIYLASLSVCTASFRLHGSLSIPALKIIWDEFYGTNPLWLFEIWKPIDLLWKPIHPQPQINTSFLFYYRFFSNWNIPNKFKGNDLR